MRGHVLTGFQTFENSKFSKLLGKNDEARAEDDEVLRRDVKPPLGT